MELQAIYLYIAIFLKEGNQNKLKGTFIWPNAELSCFWTACLEQIMSLLKIKIFLKSCFWVNVKVLISHQKKFCRDMFIHFRSIHTTKICTQCRVSEAKIYLYHSSEITKARPHSRHCVQSSLPSRSSGPCLEFHLKGVIHIFYLLEWILFWKVIYMHYILTYSPENPRILHWLVFGLSET